MSPADLSRPSSGDGLDSNEALRFGAIGRAVAVFAMILAGWVALSSLEPPGEVPEAAEGFSLQRAMADVKALAAEPRPTGSDAHARAREYILGEIRAAGLDAEVQEAVVTAGSPPESHRLVRVQNVIGRLPAMGRGAAVMLAAHYDSVPAAPGAGDDAAGVAALLETMRVLAAGQPPERDIVFLFTDAEELGLHGARAFVDSGRAEEIGWVLNFEGRGAGGASLMFETVPGDAETMRFFSRVAPKPAASSYSYDIYSRMPNDTDFSVFREVIPAGFNFGFIEDPTAYHSAVDTPDRLDERSLLHHGVQALTLSRRLAGSSPDSGGPRAVYFSLPAYGLVVYPAGWDRAVAIGCVLLGLAVLGIGFYRRRLTAGRLTLGLLVATAAVATATLGLMGLHWLWGDGLGLAGATKGVLEPLAYAWLFTAAGLAFGVAAIAWRRLGALHLAAAAVLIWTGLAVSSAWLLASSAFLFTWPSLFAWIALLAAVARYDRGSWWPGPLAIACAVPAILIWIPTLKGVGVALGPVAVVLGVAVAMPVLLLTLQAAQLAGTGAGRWALPVVALAAGLALFGWAVGTAGPAPAHPQGDSLVYALDAESGEARWASWDDAPDSWTASVLGEEPSRRTLPAFFNEELELMTSPARALPLPAPEVEVLESTERGDGSRVFRLAVRSSRNAPFMDVAVNPAGEVRGAYVDGKVLEVSGPFRLTYHAAPEEGIELELELAGDEPVDVSVVDGSFGLPESLLPGPRASWFEPRRYPGSVRDRKFPSSDTTMIRSRHRVGIGARE